MIKYFVGQKGSGKTLQMTKDAQYFFNKGYEIYSNYPLWGYKNISLFKRQKVIGRFMYSDEFEDKLKTTFDGKKPTLFLLDEAPVLYNSRNWKNFDLDLIYALNQSRKTKVHMFMSAQKYDALDKQMRESANYVYLCERKLKFIYTVMVVRPEYFKQDEKDIFLKRYIHRRKLYFKTNLRQYFKFYDTTHIVLPEKFYIKFPELFPNPKYFNITNIIENAKRYTEEYVPI